MAHEIETMAYANAKPWHGLGTPVSDDLTVDEMLVAAGLDWSVGMEPLYTARNGEMVEVPSRKALVRETDGKVLTIAGPNWVPLQNRDAMEFFREYTEMGGAKMETAGSLRGGKLLWMLAKIDRDFVVKGRQNDTVRGHLLLSWSHEVGRAHEARTCAERVVCANTLAVAQSEGSAAYRQTHSAAFDVSKARESIQLSVDQIGRMEREANALADLKLSQFDAARFYAQLLQPVDLDGDLTEEQHVAQLLEDPAKRGRVFRSVWASYNTAPGADIETAWGVFNGITHYADHTAVSRGIDGRLDSAWFGERSRLKQKAYEQLLEMV
jgi:phage/plasmid-like protein (TIGR03299 family)